MSEPKEAYIDLGVFATTSLAGAGIAAYKHIKNKQLALHTIGGNNSLGKNIQNFGPTSLRQGYTFNHIPNMDSATESRIINAIQTNPATLVSNGQPYDKIADANLIKKIQSGGELGPNLSIEDLKNFLTQNNVNINAKDKKIEY
ncbi:MAG: hypothetical protein NMK33_00450 [Candidatus Cardinium sp.]|uniref:hypothetical protein n=1 Tax=Cardinium endosymbiont of Dermatophagoides farinae TaxID=2597823 RepID=UPI0011832F8C|nr:hypothetical protein [Cardinium endosymbiont of Dermatophagoides farinae]TSJ81001.1 hypothetical protein FPG78_03130 [Cardinium endosymbiont of Dermatophagoides farinae]UWW97026.1 MAG: hypothetical protein NMK33_00450 [Candidatus Cardinium sp.]